MTATVRIYVITYRRPHLLRRALHSLMRQTRSDWVAEVLNDDPADHRVESLLSEMGDPRVRLSRPAIRRGGTGNFNYAFREIEEPFAAILEDDNWWEPEFLAVMLDALDRHPTVTLACGNEKIWTERQDGSWIDTGRTIWPSNELEILFGWRIEDKCGSAKLCNSALLFRTTQAERMQTLPTIPIEVTEHFRERVVPHPLVLVHRPLVNYAETLMTHRSSDKAIWSFYQMMLVGSAFAIASADSRVSLAAALWRRARSTEPLFATTLLTTGLLVPEARALWRAGRSREKLRFAVHFVRRLSVMIDLHRAQVRDQSVWRWLTRVPDAVPAAKLGTPVTPVKSPAHL